MRASNVIINSAVDSRYLELVIKRVFDAPRDLVFKAWSQPAHLQRWQNAPQGFTVTGHEMDLQPGGS